MNIYFEQSIQKFSDKVTNLLEEKEACNNLLLGLVERMKSQPMIEGVYLGLVENDGKVIYCLMQTPGNNWILPDVNHVPPIVLKCIVHTLIEQEKEIPGVIGPTTATVHFVQEYHRLKEKEILHEHMKQRIYQLHDVKLLPEGPGELVVATMKYHDLISDWLVQFGKQINESMTEEQAKEMATRFIEQKSSYLWMVNQVPVSMVNKARATRHGATVNAVFTPDKFKRKGYATNAVSALSLRLLQEGYRFCALYTDDANPTSNGIYQKIGYEQVGTSIVYRK
ncbi:GNAT family N-acetyltransferase [Virgibacillus soli]|uniref:GNAT family N-acetyltransferase n=1 Tax=Paracerasibacillus soli TaxID=480284 RepID=A0ABU5CT96_9BACI|nr:GNAT family N-acetyltransferase [Virgibacillus soli]MDY0409546.1 GNAT family N-acetyltransferase [Virgibacillus soli]